MINYCKQIINSLFFWASRVISSVRSQNYRHAAHFGTSVDVKVSVGWYDSWAVTVRKTVRTQEVEYGRTLVDSYRPSVNQNDTFRFGPSLQSMEKRVGILERTSTLRKDEGFWLTLEVVKTWDGVLDLRFAGEKDEGFWLTLEVVKTGDGVLDLRFAGEKDEGFWLTLEIVRTRDGILDLRCARGKDEGFWFTLEKVGILTIVRDCLQGALQNVELGVHVSNWVGTLGENKGQ